MTSVYATPGYPYPDVHGPISHCGDMQGYNEARLAWRLSLSDSVVRSMASDYRMGKNTEDNYDAYLEYLQRFEHTDVNARIKKTPSRRGRRKSRD